MTDAVKRRAYRSERRAKQAEQTRSDIVAAAGTLFRDGGFAATPTAAVAARAGVAVETVYRVFGTKAALFRAVVEAAVAGGANRARTPVADRPAIRAIIDEADPYRQIALYAATQPGIHRRSGGLLRALAAAAVSDPELAALWAELEDDRFSGQARLVTRLAAAGALQPGLDPDRAAAILWALCSLSVRDALVVARGWSDDEYRDWLAAALTRELLPASRAAS